MATHPSTLAWRIPWRRAVRLQCIGSQKVGQIEATEHAHTYILLHNYKTEFYSEKECFMTMKSQTMKFSIIGRIAFQCISCLL